MRPAHPTTEETRIAYAGYASAGRACGARVSPVGEWLGWLGVLAELLVGWVRPAPAGRPAELREVVREWAGGRASGVSTDALVWCAVRRGGERGPCYMLCDPDWAGELRTGMVRAVRAFVLAWGSVRVIRNAWRRLFCRYVDFARSVRGDAVLPRARVRLPEGGCGPPGGGTGERPEEVERGPGTSPGTALKF